MKPQPLKAMSIDELLDLEIDLLEERAADEPTAISQLIQVYKELLRKIRMERGEDFSYLKEQVTEHLVDHLIKYGTYLKATYQKDERLAKDSLEEALRYNKHIPIAHYRLGFLAYRNRDYSEALVHFEKALKLNKMNNQSKYHLNGQQNYYTHLYLTNSALYVAEAAQQSLQSIASSEYESLSNYEISPFYNMISSNEVRINQKAYSIITEKGTHFCSKEEVEEFIDLKNTLVLYFDDRNNQVFYNEEMVLLGQNQAEILRYLLLQGTEQSPATKLDMIDLFTRSDVPNNTFRKAVTRLKDKLEEILFNTRHIQSKGTKEIPAYYYDRQIPFVIIHRSDADFILTV